MTLQFPSRCWGFLSLEFNFALVVSDRSDCRFCWLRGTEREQMSRFHFSQFASISRNQGDGTAAEICGEIKLPRARAGPGPRSLSTADGGPASAGHTRAPGGQSSRPAQQDNVEVNSSVSESSERSQDG